MAAISTAHAPSAAMTTITPPSSGHDDRSWDYDSYQRAEVSPSHSCSAPSETTVSLLPPLPSGPVVCPPDVLPNTQGVQCPRLTLQRLTSFPRYFRVGYEARQGSCVR